jgi:aminoglycoside phosphotransferase (APT) family kinase protein
VADESRHTTASVPQWSTLDLMTTSARVRQALEEVLGRTAVATHRHNHTGTDKLSFEVLVGGERLWVKVAANDEEDAGLKTWASVAAQLADRHGAPPVLDVLEVAGRTGLLFPFLDGEVASHATVRDRYAEVQAVLDGLHSDRDLAERLGGPSTSAEVFRYVWVSRFDADLEIIAGYVAPDIHEYLSAEVEALTGLVDSLDERVHVAMHGDPWHENLMFGPERVWLLDWEELSVGDPVVDDAILLMDARGARGADWPPGARFDVARRSLMLDAAVDSAADWVQNSDPSIQAWKEKAYLDGLEAYRAFVTRP